MAGRVCPVANVKLIPMNGTTRCPHCETRFKITDAQLSAHQGMVRCGHCMQSFDARPTFIPDQMAAQPDQLIDQIGVEESLVATGGLDETEAVTAVSASSSDESERQDVIAAEVAGSTALESDDALDFSQMAATQSAAQQESVAEEAVPAEVHQSQAEALAHEIAEEELAVPQVRRTWPWVAGAFFLVLLLVAQSAYFFRVSFATHVPRLKPALVGYCQLLKCSVPLPQQSELMSIESSGLEAAPDHENEITFSALLRNRATYTMAFPVLALTLNDDQDKTLARRLFKPVEYLPAGESEQTGFLSNREVSLTLRLNTGQLRPVGYRLELFYPQH